MLHNSTNFTTRRIVCNFSVDTTPSLSQQRVYDPIIRCQCRQNREKLYFVVITKTPSQSAPGGSAMQAVQRAR